MSRIALVVSLALVVILVPADVLSTWQFGSITPDANRFAGSALAYDGNHTGHIIYADGDQVNLYYATVNEQGITQEIIHHFPDAPSPDIVICFMDIAVDWNNQPHVFWFNTREDILYYGTLTPDGWQKEVLRDPWNTCQDLAISVDHDNQPRIVYFDYVNDQILHCRKTGTSWQIDAIRQDMEQESVDLAIDGMNRSHICFQQYNPGSNDLYDLVYGVETDDVWQFEILDSYLECYEYNGDSVSLAIDRAGNPWISQVGFDVIPWSSPSGWPSMGADYYYGTDLLRKVGNTWQVTNFSSDFDSVSIPFGTSLELDNLGRPMFLHYRGFAQFTSPEHWAINLINFKYVGKDSLAVTSTGKPVVAYHDSNDTLLLAWEEDDLMTRLEMPDRYISPGDSFQLHRNIENNLDQEFHVQEWLALQIDGQFLFYPDWTGTPQSIDRHIAPFLDHTEALIPAFTWPVGVAPMYGLEFWSALTDAESGDLISLSKMAFQIAGD